MQDVDTTCGVLLTDGSRFLICHPTKSKYWDIPKGKQDPGESFAGTAIRELKEETGISAKEDQLEYIGQFPYRPDKNLALFWLKVDTMPDPKALICKSTFQSGMTYLPEMDSFAIVERKRLLVMVNPNMQKVLSDII